MVVYLKHHPVLACNIDAFKTFILFSIWVAWRCGRCTGTPFKIQTSKNRVARVMVQYHSWSSDVACFPDAPKADVFFAATNHSAVVNRAELQTQDVKVRGLFCRNFRLVPFMYFADVPNNNQFFVMCILSNTGKETAIWTERHTLDACDRHCNHWQTAGSLIVPNSNYTVLTLLSWSKHWAWLTCIEAYYRRWVSEKEFLLSVWFNIKSNQSSTWSVDQNILCCNSGPLQVETTTWRISNYVFELHYWVLL